ncbi:MULTISPECIES: reverse transcriptase domain-containing protein [Acidithiobacillus]|uniref:Reverse transcriptase domain-containing protein n=2 Tax=Acidithiobacillus TaxID=119977 RepID=A0A179B885_ACIFR|nr:MULTISPECIES: reverse transcriptase domain-containing protein [Acidithiobacillus]MDA8181625.1 reverse transcriptase domain-containing protein [Acidithiobacillus sp.]MEB8487447.1 reverse transcriptase domain-containing protein [Acidithiobacillus ferriphilus]MEB8489982.1 reverse transcriptase domain-containing protein [Acidithiobacillus ferriphilus]MEB8492570.1 reverse transcriptase domain-containing protein [Acidithiobacillus ferriphilus]MEB8513727.1 reverse transcriptase domain-containing p
MLEHAHTPKLTIAPVYVNSYFKPVGKEVSVKVPTGEKKKGFFSGEKDITKTEKRWEQTGCVFRPERSAYQAVREVQATIRAGYGWVVDMDLQAFFERVNHDRLMARLKSRCLDTGLLRLVNRFLKAGVSVGGHIETTTMGAPQGGPLSPVLANVVLDELDWELDRRGHRFARYADDCDILVRSKRAGERVMGSVTRYVSDTLRLTVNPLKSAVDRPKNRKFLGFTVSRNGARLKDRVRELTRRTRGNNIGVIVAELRKALLGWKAYFGIAEVLSPLRDIDKWVRRKLRCYLWKQWGSAGYRQLRKRGVSVREAWIPVSRLTVHGGCRRRRR